MFFQLWRNYKYYHKQLKIVAIFRKQEKMKKVILPIAIGILLVALVFGSELNIGASQPASDWWLSFRHSSAHTGYSTSLAPTTNQTLWIYSTGASVDSSPAVVNGVVYVGSIDHKVYALDAENGRQLWNYTTGDAVESSPAVVGGVVYVGSNDNKVYALDASDGTSIWNFTASNWVTSSPAISNGTVYIGSNDHRIYALNATNGALIWNFTTGAEVASSPAVYSGKVYVGSKDTKLYCLNAATGASIWNYSTANSVTSSPAVVNGKVFFGSYDASIYCLDASNGTRIWQFAEVGILSSPAVAEGKVYIGQGGSYPRTKICALDENTGASIWNYTANNPVNSCPAVADGKVYAGSTDNRIYALNSTNGALVWSYQSSNSVTSSPAIAEGKLYVGSYDNKVYAFSSLPTPTFALAANVSTIIPGGFFKLTGTLSLTKTSPPNITLQWSKDNSGFIFQQTFDTIANGVYTRDIAFSSAGTYQLRAIWPGDSTSNSGTSNVVTVVVQNVIPEFPTTSVATVLLMAFSAWILILGRKSRTK
jgi:outer membrane protein assembly factor BamB